MQLFSWPMTTIKSVLYTFILFYCSVAEGIQSVETLLSHGTNLLASGKIKEAIDVYSQAIDADPDNYMARYRRATAYMALGQHRSALVDIDKTVALNPGYILAHKQRANLNVKLGNLKGARASLLILKSGDDGVASMLNTIDEMEANINHARVLYSSGQYADALPLLDYVLKTITSNGELLEMSAICKIKTGDRLKGIEEFRSSVHLVGDNREGLLRVSKLMYDAGLAERSLEEIRACLRLDQDDKKCRAHYAKVRKLAKVITDAHKFSDHEKWDKCLSSAKKILELEGENLEYLLQGQTLICHCGARENPAASLEACDYTISKVAQTLEPHLDKAEAFVNLERYEEAEVEYKEVLKVDEGNSKAREGLDKLKKLRQMGKRRDYYKILGIKRTATKKEINQAYRELAGKNHPDKFSNEDEKRAAEKRFIDINDAREVLLDKDMRAQFDSGVDPKDPEAQQNPFGRGGGPYPHGFPHGHPFFTDSGPFGGFQFHQFGGGGPGGNGHFEFHFG